MWISSASNFVYAIATLTFTGSYSTGGDAVDFTTVADKLPSTQIIPGIRRIAERKQRLLHRGAGERDEQLEAEGIQRRRHGITAGAYPASVTTDIRPAQHHRAETLVARPPPVSL